MKGTAYLLQAALLSLWWIGLYMNQEFFNAFQFPNIEKTAFLSFFIPDIVVIAILSIIRAYNSKKELEYVILGGFVFATLYCVNASFLTKGGYLATTTMILGLCYNLFLVFENKVFKESASNNVFVNGFKTIVQIICVWAITLVVFPWIIMKSFGSLPTIVHDNKIVGLILLSIFSVIGLYSALIMVKKGKGTPLPIDQTKNLVINGPYRYVRNPMAIAGLGQGIAVSILFGSVYVLVYTVLGGILWQFVVRPIEEKNMKLRFGQEYEDYRRKVKCWIPKFSQKQNH